MRTLGAGLYLNQPVTFKEEYRRTAPRRATCVREVLRRVENRSILADLNMNGTDGAENCSTGPKSKVHSGIANHRNGETVLISELSDLLRHVTEETLYCKDGIPKRLLDESKMKFSEYTVNVYR